MRGGDRQRIWRAVGRDTAFAHLLIEKMWDSQSIGGVQFRSDYRRLLNDWRRWLVVLERWWQQNHGGMPYHHLPAYQQFFDTLDCRGTVYPKPRPLNASQIVAYRHRSEIAAAAAGPMFVALPARRTRAGDPAFVWASRMSDRASRWVREIYDEVNPGQKWRHSRGLHHAFRRDVEEFCERWSLRAWWAVPMLTHLFVLSAEFEVAEPLHLNVRGPYSVLSWRLYVPLPGFSGEEVQHSIEEMNDLITLWSDDPDHDFRVVHQPDRDELREIEAKRQAACVALDWNGDHAEGYRTVLEWAVAEVEKRLDRRVTKREKATMSKALDPQVREARKWFIDNGQFEVEGHALVGTHAEWCARMLLDPGRTYLHFVRDGENPDNVRMRCNEFAARASLRWPPHRQTSG